MYTITPKSLKRATTTSCLGIYKNINLRHVIMSHYLCHAPATGQYGEGYSMRGAEVDAIPQD